MVNFLGVDKGNVDWDELKRNDEPLKKQSQVGVEELVQNWEDVESWGVAGNAHSWREMFANDESSWIESAREDE